MIARRLATMSEAETYGVIGAASALAGIVVGWPLFTGDTDTVLATALSLGPGLAFVLAAILARRDRRPMAAVVAGGTALLVAATVALVFGDVPTVLLLGPIAFVIALPHLRGRRLAALGALTVASAALVATPWLVRPVSADESPARRVAIVVGSAVALAILAVFSWRLHRSAEDAARRYASLVGSVPIGIARVGADRRWIEANDALVRMLGTTRDDLVGRPIEDVFADEAAVATAFAPRAADPIIIETRAIRRDGVRFWIRLWNHPVVDPGGTVRWFDGAIEDITAERTAHETSEELSSIVASAGDAMFSKELDGTIRTWNAGAEQLYGWTAEEAIGRSVLELVDAGQEDFARQVLGRVANGERVGPVEVSRRARDGSQRIVSLIVSPTRDADGRVVRAAEIARDLTDRRRLEARLDRWRLERDLVVAALREMTPGSTPELTAASICHEIRRSGFELAALVGFTPDGGSAYLALDSGRPDAVPIESTPTAATTQHLRRRARLGAWVEGLRRVNGQLAAAARDADIQALAFAPVVHGTHTVGVLVAGSAQVTRAELEERLPALGEFAAIAAPLLGPGLLSRGNVLEIRARIREIIESGTYTTVFQPIVDLASGVPIGYEALTRFADGTPPDRLFDDARVAGLGLELEAATLHRHLISAGPLPANLTLHVNVSPELVLAGEPLRTFLAEWGFGTAVEITEHSAITDYEEFRQAVATLPQARLAIDDAGAGFASLRHIVELRPEIVKLDRALVEFLDRDPTRRALVAGMIHFAEGIGATLVAEGIETEAERAALLRLGVRVGQGFLFGRPAELDVEAHSSVVA